MHGRLVFTDVVNAGLVWVFRDGVTTGFLSEHSFLVVNQASIDLLGVGPLRVLVIQRVKEGGTRSVAAVQEVAVGSFRFWA